MEQANHTKPFIVDKNLGAALDIDNAALPQTTSDGMPVVPPTQEQKYLFDMRGWLLAPGVLSGDELKEIQEFCHRLRHEPESIPEHERSPLGGPMQKLADHPNVVGFLNEFLAHPALSSQECYGFRMELYCHRKFGPLSKTRLWYNIHLLERSIRWRNENEETSPPSLKPKLFLRLSAVKVPKQKCVGDITSAMNNFQSGSDSFLKKRRPSLNPLINSLMPLRSGSPNLSNSLGG